MPMADPGNDGTNLLARVVAELRCLIVSAELTPGTPISEGALAESFGVSRTPVREALKQLQSEGLVETRPRVGTFVTTPSRREFVELLELRAVLEGAAARLLAERGTADQLRRLAKNLAETGRAADAGDRGRLAKLMREFHELLVAGADNAKFESHYRMLLHQLAYARTVDVAPGAAARDVHASEDHGRVHERIAAGDGDTAEQLMREHVRGRGCVLVTGVDDSIG